MEAPGEDSPDTDDEHMPEHGALDSSPPG